MYGLPVFETKQLIFSATLSSNGKSFLKKRRRKLADMQASFCSPPDHSLSVTHHPDAPRRDVCNKPVVSGNQGRRSPMAQRGFPLFFLASCLFAQYFSVYFWPSSGIACRQKRHDRKELMRITSPFRNVEYGMDFQRSQPSTSEGEGSHF